MSFKLMTDRLRVRRATHCLINPRCFPEQETFSLLLSTGWLVQERIRV